MIATEKPKKLAPQACPLCGEHQDIIINGWEPDTKNPIDMRVSEEKGYSFCNCHNVFFTDWKNINQGTYDPDYYKKYSGDTVTHAMINMANYHMGDICLNLPDNKDGKHSILEVGAINPAIMDMFANRNFKTTGLDIHDHPFGSHKLEVGNFEDIKLSEKFDAIWASHVFEHFKSPVSAAIKCNQLLNDGGVLFVAMPDPWFIDFSAPYAWGHWHLNEHHILWDMESFAEVLRKIGFQIIRMGHNTQSDQICNLDFYITAKKIYPVDSYKIDLGVVNV